VENGPVPADPLPPSARRDELLALAYRYVLRHGLADMSLRPLAEAIGSSPRVLLFLFGSKDGLVRALLGVARAAELEVLHTVRAGGGDATEAVHGLWAWLAAPEHRDLLRLWAEGYARAVIEPDGPWGGFAADSVRDWLDVLSEILSPGSAPDPAAVDLTADHHSAGVGTGSGPVVDRATAVLALLRGALLDLLATGDTERTGAAVRIQLAALTAAR
jgi:AcrR family transcriptional regulator